MSLVSEALRKARQEAAQREAQERGSVPTAHLAGLRARRGGSLVALVAVAVAAALAGAGLAWWGSSRSGRRPTVAVPPAPVAATAAASPETAAHMPVASATVAPAEALPPVAPPAEPKAAPASAAAISPLPRQTPAVALPGPTAPPATTASAPPVEGGNERADRAQATPADERSFLLDADLGYARLHLDFIVYKPSAPFGRINGRDIVVGSIVDGFRVEEIAPEWVRLRDARGVVVLRAR